MGAAREGWGRGRARGRCVRGGCGRGGLAREERGRGTAGAGYAGATETIRRGARGTADERCGGGKASGDGVGVGSGQQRGRGEVQLAVRCADGHIAYENQRQAQKHRMRHLPHTVLSEFMLTASAEDYFSLTFFLRRTMSAPAPAQIAIITIQITGL